MNAHARIRRREPFEVGRVTGEHQTAASLYGHGNDVRVDDVGRASFGSGETAADEAGGRAQAVSPR